MRGVFALLAFLLLALGTAQAQEANRAALVVALADGRVETRCIAFAEPELSGRELLARSGLTLAIEERSMGAAVCGIEETGCPADDCWCQCQGANCRYWSYWHGEEAGWQYAAAGASSYRVRNGALEGWSWGPGAVDEAVPPPEISFVEICADGAESVAGEAAPKTTTLGWKSLAPFALVVLLLAGSFVWVQRRREAA